MSEPNRVELIRECLEETLNPTELEIVDDSHLHAGHSGHGGAGHFQLHIVSEKFNVEPSNHMAPGILFISSTTVSYGE